MFIISAVILAFGFIFGIGLIREMIEQKGVLSTILFIVSLPLCFFSIKTVLNMASIFLKYFMIENNLLEYFNVVGISSFVLIGSYIITIMGSFVSGYIYSKKQVNNILSKVKEIEQNENM